MPKPKAPSKTIKTPDAPLAKSAVKPAAKTAGKAAVSTAPKKTAKLTMQPPAKRVTKPSGKTVKPTKKTKPATAVKPGRELAKPAQAPETIGSATAVAPDSVSLTENDFTLHTPIVGPTSVGMSSSRPEQPIEQPIEHPIETDAGAKAEPAPVMADAKKPRAKLRATPAAKSTNKQKAAAKLPKRVGAKTPAKTPAKTLDASEGVPPSKPGTAPGALPVSAPIVVPAAETSGSGARIRKLRLAANMTQEQLADAVSALGSKVSRSAVAQWETNRATPDDPHIEHLSKVLATTVGFLRTSRLDDVSSLEMLVMQRMRRMSADSINLLVTISEKILAGDTPVS